MPHLRWPDIVSSSWEVRPRTSKGLTRRGSRFGCNSCHSFSTNAFRSALKFIGRFNSSSSSLGPWHEHASPVPSLPSSPSPAASYSPPSSACKPQRLPPRARPPPPPPPPLARLLVPPPPPRPPLVMPREARRAPRQLRAAFWLLLPGTVWLPGPEPWEGLGAWRAGAAAGRPYWTR